MLETNYSYLKPPKMPGYSTLANNLGFFWTSSSAWAIYLKISKIQSEIKMILRKYQFLLQIL